MRISMLID